MRFERWWWLPFFCIASLCIHGVLVWRSRSFMVTPLPPRTTEIEVALEPLPEPKPEPEKPKKPAEPEKAEKPKPQPKPAAPKPDRKPSNVVAPKAKPNPKPAVEPGKPAPPRMVKADEPRPTAPKAEPGGVERLAKEKPLPLGLTTGKKEIAPRPIRMARATPDLKAKADTPDLPDRSVKPDELPDGPLKADASLPTLPRRSPTDGRSMLSVDNPLAGAAPVDKPGVNPGRAPGGPRIARLPAAPPNFAGGGSPAPGPVPGGRDGLKAPETPPDDLVFNGGGAGGMKLPTAAPRIGGGGGRSILSVNNPLAKEAVPDEKPGIGPGTGGGSGAGGGGGVGYARGKGVGTDPDGKVALGTLRKKPGAGIGAGSGDGIGTRSPGGGRGTGAELPGTGGTGFGYGRGSGTGFGNGSGLGIAGGSVGGGGVGRAGGGSGGGGGGTGGRFALNRGIPFGDLSGLLRGGDADGGRGKGGGPGGPGRGTAFGGKPRGGSPDAPVQIIYLLDISTSMTAGNKMGKAQEALKKALSELKPRDSFNIVTFCAEIDQFAASTVTATPENIKAAQQFVDDIRMRGGTYMSGALERAFAHEKVTHVFLLSDGEPSRGITNPEAIRLLVRERNRVHAQILTLALGLGEQFPGIPLLKSLAEDNDGAFSYVNLAR